MTDITDPFYSRMIRSAETIALEFGYSVLFAESGWDPGKEIRVVSNMIESRVRGLLMCFCEKTPQSMTLIERSNLHVIAVDTYPPATADRTWPTTWRPRGTWRRSTCSRRDAGPPCSSMPAVR